MKQLFVAVTVLAALAGTARAQAPSSAPVIEADEEETEERYGIQIFAVDAAVVLGAALTQSGGLLIGGYALGAPLVHLAHGNMGGAVASAGLHVALPLAGMRIGAASATCEEGEWFCGLGEMILGAAAGGLIATTIDAAFLAKADRKTERAPFRYGRVRATPTAAAAPHGMSLGIAGTF